MQTVIAVTSLLVTGACQAQVHEGDIILFVSEEDRIETGTQEGAGFRIFTESLDNGFSPNPGFDSFNDTFTPGEIIGLDVIRALHVWNGEDFWEIAEPVLRVTKFGQEIETPACDRRVSEEFVFGSANDSGKFHHHVSFFLNPTQPGIYLLAFDLWALDGAPAPSAPAYIVFEEVGHQHDAEEAYEWVVDHLFQLDCPADMNGDGLLNILDFVAMQTTFQAGEPRADINGDCMLNVLDFVAYQGEFVAGCD